MTTAESYQRGELNRFDHSSTVCLYVVDANLWVRGAFCSGQDSAPSELQPGWSVLELVPGSDGSKLQERLRQAFTTGRSGQLRYALELEGRGKREYEARITPIGKGHRPETVNLAIIDVTELVAESRRARRRNAEFETLPDTYFRIARDGTILDYHSSTPDDLYAPPGQFLGRRLQEVMPAHVSSLWEEHLPRVRQGEETVSYEFILELPRGPQHFEARLNALPDCEDIIVVTRNITARRVAETRLLESNRRLEEAQAVAHVGSWEWDVDADRATWTPEMYRIFAVDPGRFQPSMDTVLDHIPPDEHDRFCRHIDQWLDGVDAGPLDFRIRRHDGTERHVSARAKVDRLGDRAIRLVGTIQDVTERKQTELALIASEERFRRTVELSWDMVALMGPDSEVRYVNDSIARVLSLPPHDFVGKRAMDIVHPEDLDRAQKVLSDLIANPGQPETMELRVRDGDGGYRWLEIVARNLLNAPGLGAIVANARDVTERVRQQRALEHAHREADMFRRMVDLSTQGIGTASMDTKVMYMNPALLSLLGIQSLENARTHSYEDFYAPKDLDFLRHEVIATVLAEGNWTGELNLLPLTGEPVPTIHSLYLLRDDAGKPIAFSNVVADISAQKRTERALRTSESKYRGLFEGALFGIVVADIETGEILDCNPAICHMVGRSYDELVGQPQRILHPPTPLDNGVTPTFELHRSGRASEVKDDMLITANGYIRYAEIKANTVEWEGRNALQGVFHDITERKLARRALKEEKERAQVTLRSIGDAVITTDDRGRVDFLNPVAERLTGWKNDEAFGRNLDEIFQTCDEATGEPAENPVVRCLRDEEIVTMSRPTVLIARDGKQYDIADSAAPIRRSDGTILGTVLVFHDVSKARQLTRKMAYDASHDSLTGLLNRRAFEHRLHKALESARRHEAHHALCYIDLDQFKVVNDSAGHAAGDALLKHVKEMFEGVFRERDTLARLGGDEFGLLLDNCPVERAVSIATQVIDVIRAYRFVWDGRCYRVGASIGIATITEDSESVARLLSQADVACYTAKELGRNRVHVYDEQGGAPIRHHGEILQAAGLRDALELDRFQLYCQPIVPLNDGNHTGAHYEILLRLLDSDGNLALPSAFIPAAERFGLIGELDRWVIRTTFQSYKAVFGKREARISLNLSGKSLNDDTLLDYVREQFERFLLSPGQVCFEITETAAVHDIAHATQFLSKLKGLGCELALDDFGSGLSSLRYLKALPVDYLKIDGSFVEGIADDAGDYAIVAAVNNLAHQLGIRSIAEDVSNERIIDKLRGLNIDFVQGYAIGLPVPFT